MQKALERSKLKELNVSNLQQGLDSEGRNLPPYASPDYANFKTSINPRNRGFWDLRVTGDYYQGIKVTIRPAIVFFEQVNQGQKYEWLETKMSFYNNVPLGLSAEQWHEVQMSNKPYLRRELDKIISNV